MYQTVVAYALAHTMYLVTNYAFEVPRPWLVDPEIIPAKYSHGYSFPSGHVALVTSFFGMLCVTYRKKSLVVVTAALVVTVAFCRMLLGSHTPIDIVGGLSIGLASIAITNWALIRYEPDYTKLNETIVAATLAGVAVWLVWVYIKQGLVSDWDFWYVVSMTAMPVIPLAAFILSNKIGL